MPIPLDLDYAGFADELSRRDRAVVWCGIAGLLGMGLFPCFSIVMQFVYVVAYNVPLAKMEWGWEYTWQVASGPLCLALVVAALWRRRTPGSVRRWAKLVASVTLLSLSLPIYSAVNNWQLSSGFANWTLPSRVALVLQVLSVMASSIALLTPISLVGVTSPPRWRGRLLALCAVCCVVAGLAGVSDVLRTGMRIQASIGGSLLQGIQSAIQRPLPLVGLWPLAGYLAAGIFLASISRPNVIAIRMAVLLGTGFVLGRIVSDWNFIRSFSSLPAIGNAIANILLLTVRPLCDLLPLALLAWATWAERESFELEGDTP